MQKDVQFVNRVSVTEHCASGEFFGFRLHSCITLLDLPWAVPPTLTSNCILNLEAAFMFSNHGVPENGRLDDVQSNSDRERGRDSTKEHDVTMRREAVETLGCCRYILLSPLFCQYRRPAQLSYSLHRGRSCILH